MTLNYADSEALMRDLTFQGRVKCACLKFADYILGEAHDVPAHNTRVRWANTTFAAPDAAATQVTPIVVMDPAVQAAGEMIADADLQSAVEASINKLL